MSVWDITVRPEEFHFGNAQVFLYKIKSDSAITNQELIHSHSYFELHLVCQGSHIYSIGEKSICVRAGELIIIGPDVEHKAALPQKETKISVLSVRVNRLTHGENVFPVITERLNACSGMALPLDSVLAQRIRDYDPQTQQLKAGDLFHCKLFACEILVGIFDAIVCSSCYCANNTHVDFDIMLETLVCNSNVPLFEIAQRLGYSPRHISRKIRQRYGRSLTQLRKETK